MCISILGISDDSGTTVQDYTYSALGEIQEQSGTDMNRITYTAREALGDSLGFYYYRNRVMDPTTGRFISEDPLGFIDGPNRYVYVRNNPLLWIDPFGLAPGDEYPSMDDAGKAAICDIHDTSIREDREYAGWIFKNRNGTYTYSKPKRGTKGYSLPPQWMWPWQNPQAFYHTHGAGDGEDFSEGDKGESKKWGIPNYLGTPAGKVKKYTPGKGTTPCN